MNTIKLLLLFIPLFFNAQINPTSIIKDEKTIERSYFGVFQTGEDITSKRVVFKEGGTSKGFKIYLQNGQIYFGVYNTKNKNVSSTVEESLIKQVIKPNTVYLFSFIYESDDTTKGKITLYLNGSNVGTITNSERVFDHDITQIGDENGIVQNKPSGGAGTFFNSEIDEFLNYNYVVNSAQRIIIQNYLSAKHDIGLVADDLYDEDNSTDGNFDHDVSGIGRINSSNIQNQAKGIGRVRILNAQNLDDNEFLICGHNNGVQKAIETSDVPSTVESRFDRVWRFSEVNTSSSPVNIGLIDIQFDLNGLDGISASDLRLLIDEDNDGLFNDETPITGAINSGNGIYSFQNISAGKGGTRNNKRFTLGKMNTCQTPLPIDFTNCSELKIGNSSTIISNDIEIYPNPTSNLIYIEGDKLELSELKVFNSIGQDVSLNTTITFLNSAKVKVDLSKLPTGIYSIKTRSKYSLVQVTALD